MASRQTSLPVISSKAITFASGLPLTMAMQPSQAHAADQQSRFCFVR
jgi:hypothetical protein